MAATLIDFLRSADSSLHSFPAESSSDHYKFFSHRIVSLWSHLPDSVLEQERFNMKYTMIYREIYYDSP